jgi:hypothetical protein
MTLRNRNLFTSVSFPSLIQLIDVHDLIKAMTIAADVKFQGLASPSGINLFQKNVVGFSLTI